MLLAHELCLLPLRITHWCAAEACSHARNLALVQDPENLKAVREKLETEGISAEQRHVLQIMEKTFKVNIIEDPKAAQLKVNWYQRQYTPGRQQACNSITRCGRSA